MSTASIPRLGAPGIYPVAGPPPAPALTPVRLDVAGFVGVALRGPVDVAVEVTRWSDFVAQFGGFEPTAEGAQRLLPYAVQAFFAQGGAKAYVLRVVAHTDGDSDSDCEAATALYELPRGGGVQIAAANEGAWGNGLAIRMEFVADRPFPVQVADDGLRLVLPPSAGAPVWSLLRLRATDDPAAHRPAVDELRWLTALGQRRTGVLDAAVPAAAGRTVDVEVVTGTVVVAESGVVAERLAGLGLHPDHVRFARCALATESLRTRPVGVWAAPLVPADTALRQVTAGPVHPGHDRTARIGYDAFFDPGGADADLLDEEPHRGVDAIGRRPEIGLLCVPDLFWRPTPPAPPSPPFPGLCEPGLAVRPEPPPPLNPLDPQDLAEIMRRQLRVVEVAALRKQFVALLDVPAGLPPRGITAWRTTFDNSYAAAYHPWLGVPRVGDPLRQIVLVPPSAFAAGIVAGRERRLGLPWGPANELAVGAVVAADALTDAQHDELHLLGINVYRAERDGFRLTAARTLSSDPEYRQLSVRRLMTMITLAIGRELQWLVFEPNTTGLREKLRRTLTDFLRGLHRRQAFAGDTEATSFFVHCDDGLNPPSSQALGRLLAEVGVAPAAPLEYLLLRVTQDVDGALQVVDEHG